MEGEAGYFRRNHWAPVPKAVDVAELNRRLLDDRRRDEQPCIAGRDQHVGAVLLIEKPKKNRPRQNELWRWRPVESVESQKQA